MKNQAVWSFYPQLTSEAESKFTFNDTFSIRQIHTPHISNVVCLPNLVIFKAKLLINSLDRNVEVTVLDVSK